MICCCQIHTAGSDTIISRCLTKAQKKAKNVFLVFLGCFGAYAILPHNHIGWARSMPFVSINSTYPRINLWNFRKIILRIGDFEKFSFFGSAILDLCLQFVFNFFCFIPMKISQSYMGIKGRSNFWWLHLFTAVSVRNNLLNSVASLHIKYAELKCIFSGLKQFLCYHLFYEKKKL